MKRFSVGGDLLEPIPPGNHIRLAGHHWLEGFDVDGHSKGLVVLQWQPGVKKWCHSGNVATGRDFNATGYRYVAECPMP